MGVGVGGYLQIREMMGAAPQSDIKKMATIYWPCIYSLKTTGSSTGYCDGTDVSGC